MESGKMADKRKDSGSDLKSVRTSAIDLLSVTAAFLAVSVLSNLAGVFAILSKYPAAAFAFFGVGASTFVGVIAKTADYLRLQRAHPKWLLRGYKLLELERVYRIHDEKKIEHSQKSIFHLKTMQYGVELFEVRYKWTGRGKEGKPQVISRGDRKS